MKSKIELVIEPSHLNESKQLGSPELWTVFERGREKWYEQIGLSLGAMYQTGLEMEIEDFLVHFRYIKKSLLGQKIVLSTQPVEIGDDYFVLKQQITNEQHSEVADAEFRLLFVSLSSLEVVSLPKPILTVFGKD